MEKEKGKYILYSQKLSEFPFAGWKLDVGFEKIGYSCAK